MKIKRKVVQHGPSTLIVSLPSNWAKKNNIKKGDEIDLDIKADRLILSSKPIKEEEKTIEADFSDLDRSSIMFKIRSLYREGYHEIKINFKNTETEHFRKERRERVISIIHKEVNNLIGVDIIEERNNSCVLKQITEDSNKNFDIIFRKIFFQFDITFNNLIDRIENNDYMGLENIEEKHDTITKFISYCLRLLNLGKVEKEKHNYQIYHTLKNIDFLTDITKYFTRYVVKEKIKFDSKTKNIIRKMLELHRIYHKLYFDYKKDHLIGFQRLRNEIKRLESKINKQKYLTYLLPMLEAERDLVETRLSMI